MFLDSAIPFITEQDRQMVDQRIRRNEVVTTENIVEYKSSEKDLDTIVGDLEHACEAYVNIVCAREGIIVSAVGVVMAAVSNLLVVIIAIIIALAAAVLSMMGGGSKGGGGGIIIRSSTTTTTRSSHPVNKLKDALDDMDREFANLNQKLQAKEIKETCIPPDDVVTGINSIIRATRILTEAIDKEVRVQINESGYLFKLIVEGITKYKRRVDDESLLTDPDRVGKLLTDWDTDIEQLSQRAEALKIRVGVMNQATGRMIIEDVKKPLSTAQTHLSSEPRSVTVREVAAFPIDTITERSTEIARRLQELTTSTKTAKDMYDKTKEEYDTLAEVAKELNRSPANKLLNQIDNPTQRRAMGQIGERYKAMVELYYHAMQSLLGVLKIIPDPLRSLIKEYKRATMAVNEIALTAGQLEHQLRTIKPDKHKESELRNIQHQAALLPKVGGSVSDVADDQDEKAPLPRPSRVRLADFESLTLKDYWELGDAAAKSDPIFADELQNNPNFNAALRLSGKIKALYPPLENKLASAKITDTNVPMLVDHVSRWQTAGTMNSELLVASRGSRSSAEGNPQSNNTAFIRELIKLSENTQFSGRYAITEVQRGSLVKLSKKLTTANRITPQATLTNRNLYSGAIKIDSILNDPSVEWMVESVQSQGLIDTKTNNMALTAFVTATASVESASSLGLGILTEKLADIYMESAERELVSKKREILNVIEDEFYDMLVKNDLHRNLISAAISAEKWYIAKTISADYFFSPGENYAQYLVRWNKQLTKQSPEGRAEILKDLFKQNPTIAVLKYGINEDWKKG